MTRAQFYTFDEAVSRLGIDEHGMKRLVAQGEVTAYREGNCMMFRRDEIDEGVALRRPRLLGVLQCPNCPKRYRLPQRAPAFFTCRGCGTTFDLSSLSGSSSLASSDGGTRPVDHTWGGVDRSTWIAFGCIGVVVLAILLAVAFTGSPTKATNETVRRSDAAAVMQPSKSIIVTPISPPEPQRLIGGARLMRRTLLVTNTWVFCDERAYGAFVLGRIPGLEANGLFWVKLPPMYRWLTSVRIAHARTIQVSGVVKGPRGSGTQVEEGEVHSIEGQPISPADLGIGWQTLVDSVFDDSATSAIRAGRWRNVRDREFADVGQLDDLTKNLENQLKGGLGLAKVKFREGAFISATSVGLASSFWENEAEKFPKGAFVAIKGRIFSTALFSSIPDDIGDISVTEATLEVVPAKTGDGWESLR